MTYTLPPPDVQASGLIDSGGGIHGPLYAADTLRAEVAKAEQRGSDDMQRECTALCMTSWSTDAERDCGQKLAEAIRSLK